LPKARGRRKKRENTINQTKQGYKKKYKKSEETTMKKYFRNTTFLFVAMLIVLMSACEPSSTPVPTNPPAIPPADTPTESVQQTADKEPVHLVFMHIKDAQGPKDALDIIFTEFTEQYPYITIEQQGMSPDNFGTVMKAKIASGDMPDIFQNTSPEYANSGLTIDLTGEDYLKNFSPDVLMASNKLFKDFNDKGTIYAIPLDNSAIGIFVNKKVLEENGLQVPKTLSEMKDACDALTAKGIAPFSAGYKDNWTAMMPLIGLYASTVYANVPDWDAKRDAGEVSIATDENWKLAFDLYREYYYGCVDKKTAFDVDYNGSIANFAEGKSAFLANGLWALQPIREAAPDLDMDFIPFPVYDDAAKNKLLVFPDTTISGSSQTKHPEEVKLFLKFLSTKFAGDTWTKYAQIGSPIIGTEANYDAIAPVINSYITSGQIVTQGDRLFRPIFNTAMWDNNISYLLGESTWDEVSAKLDAAWDQALEESKK
jgi:raffinose/stachyose/melibiose transport system substrate-binding protein